MECLFFVLSDPNQKVIFFILNFLVSYIKLVVVSFFYKEVFYVYIKI